MRDEPAAQARGPLHTRNGIAHLRHTAGQVSARVRTDRQHGGAGEGHDQPVRARLDAAFDRRPEHPHHGDGAASAGQYWRGGRRHERSARPFQYPGADRRRPALGSDAWLSFATERPRDYLRGVYEDAAVQAAAPGSDELLAELPEIRRQLPEGSIR